MLNLVAETGRTPATAAARGPEHWVDEHGDVLFKYALLRVRDTATAEEIVQETLLAALQAYERFSGQASERTWLIGILKHKVLDYFRRLSRQVSFDEPDDIRSVNDRLLKTSGEWVDHWDAALGPCDWSATPAGQLEASEFHRTLQSCVGKLPMRLAAAFALREMEELSGEEVCKVLEISPTNLWVMLHRARAQLRLCIETNWFRPAAKA